MKLKQLFTDDEAVSPVIGVILMVAITVILAAVIGTFVLGLGNQVQSTTPSANFAVDYLNGNVDGLNVTHDGGDKIPASQLKLSSDTEFCAGAANGSTAASPDCPGNGGHAAVTSAPFTRTEFNTPKQITAGDGINIRGNDALDAATIRVIWTSESGDNSATLRKWSGPSA